MKKKKKLETHGYTAYDENGEVVERYWQKEPIVVRQTGILFKLHWTKRFNPIWRFQQWWILRKPMTLGGDAYGVKTYEKSK